MSMNTALFDCQLTGCRIAEQTLIHIAQLLHRNRKVQGADMSAGPYTILLQKHVGGGGGAVSRGLALAMAGESQVIEHAMTNKVVSEDCTNEFMVRLTEWKAGHAVSAADAVRVDELLVYLDKYQKQLISDREDLARVRARTDLLTSGFQDRELRYRKNMAKAQDTLLEYSTERQSMSAAASRLGEELALHREFLDEEVKEANLARNHNEADEAQAKNTIATLAVEKQECEKRLRDLEEQSARLTSDTERLRKQSERLREHIITLRPSS
jgi:hypothetical protein